MKEKYIKYNIEELIEDRLFVAWVLRGNKNREWKKYIENNSQFKAKAKKAQEIILLLRDTCEVLDEGSVLEMWQNIDRLDQQYKKRNRTIKLRRGISWAASFLLVISLGALGYFYLNEKDTYQFASSENMDQNNEARLIFYDGEEIALTSDNSTISLNNGNKLVIINDSVIDLSQKKIEPSNEIKMNEVIIPYGKKSELLLADGTKVWLNAGSRLAFPAKFTKNNREVFLEGEAYFEVAKNEKQPFIVNVAEIDIRVLGTHFDVSAYPGDDNIETILLEGRVVVSTPKPFGLGRSEVSLEPYQKANFNKDNNTVEVLNDPNADIYIAWTEGCLQFSRESLYSVLTKLERYYNVEIRIPQNFPSPELVSGKLDLKESLADVMLALGDVAKIEYRINENIIYIDKRLKKLRKK